MDNWNEEIIKILNNVRINSLNLSEYHRRNYFQYKEMSKYFDIPVIIISILAGSFSVGASPYINQGTISVISCIASMMITILSSIKLTSSLSSSGIAFKFTPLAEKGHL